MKALIIREPGAPDVLEIQETEAPAYGPDDLLINVGAFALNRADLLQIRGKYPAPHPTRQDIPGLEYAGEVAAVGARVVGFEVGDKVMGLVPGAGYAQQVAVHHREVLRQPKGYTTAESAAIPEAFITAYDAVQLQAELRMGDTVLIHAVASGVGLAALQLARAQGARVIGTSRTASKLEGLDLDLAICTSEGPSFAEQVNAFGGADVVLDFVGSAYLNENLEALRPLGRMMVVGLLSGPMAEINLRTVLRKRLRILGTALRARPIEEKAELTQAFARRIVPLFERKRLSPSVDRVLPVSQVQDGLGAMSRNETAGKVVITWD